MPGEGPVSVWNPNHTSTSQHVPGSSVPLQPCMCPDLSSHLFPAPFPASMAIRTFIQHFAEAVAWSCLPGVRPLITGHTDFTPELISGGPKLNPWVLAHFRQMLSIWKTLNFIKKKNNSTISTPYLPHYLQQKVSSTPICGLTMKSPTALAEVIIQWIVNHIPTTHNQIYFMS